MSNSATADTTKRVVVKRTLTNNPDLFDNLPRELVETIEEVHFADGSREENVGQVGAYSIDLPDEWIERFRRASNLIKLVVVRDLGLGEWVQHTPSEVITPVEESSVFDELPGEILLSPASPQTASDGDQVAGLEGPYQKRGYRKGPVLDQGREGACFPAGVLVRMADGTHKPIENVGLLDRVRTAEGNTGRVLSVFARNHSKGLTKVRLRGHSGIESTPNHPFLTKRGYVAAEDLKVGDEVALTKHRISRTSSKTVRLSDWLRKEDYGRRTNHGLVGSGGVLTEVSAPPEVIPISPELGRLVGLYLAEGATTPNKVTWTFSKDEEHTLVAETVRLLRDVLGVRARLQYRPNNSINVVCYGKLWRVLFERMFGTGSSGKMVCKEIMDSPEEVLREVLGGWLDGDGHRRRSSVTATTVSRTLAFDMYSIASALGLMPTINQRDPIINRHAAVRREMWEVSIAEGGGRKQSTQDGSSVWRKVVEVSHRAWSGIVYNLHVEGDESYVADGVGVHNCTGFCGANFINGGPMMKKPFLTDQDALNYYYENRRIDEWPGENYDGSSVSAMCKQLISLGRIKEAYYTTNFDTMVKWKQSGKGGLMISTPWYEGMYVTDSNGFIRPTGRKVGGHAIWDRAVTSWLSAIWFNSWGDDFGFGGDGYVSEVDYRWLIGQGLRAYMATQVK